MSYSLPKYYFQDIHPEIMDEIMRGMQEALPEPSWEEIDTWLNTHNIASPDGTNGPTSSSPTGASLAPADNKRAGKTPALYSFCSVILPRFHDSSGRGIIASKNMKAYLNNAVVSAIGKGDVSASELTILKELLDFFEAKKLELVTSSVTAREIAQYRGLAKADIENVYTRLEKVSFIEDHEVLGFHSYWDRFGGVSYPLVQDDPTSSALRKMRLGPTDAHHLMLAIRAGCERFITYDKGILSRSLQIENAFSIKAMRPAELLAELNASLVHPYDHSRTPRPQSLDAKKPDSIELFGVSPLYGTRREFCSRWIR